MFDFLTLSVAFWGWVGKVGWGFSESNRAASHTARLWSGQGAGFGRCRPREPWRKGGWFCGGHGGRRHSLTGGGQRRDHVVRGWTAGRRVDRLR